MRTLRLSSLLISILLASCSRRAPEPEPAPAALAQHGWVELRVADASVPADPISLMDGEQAQPPPCHVEVDLDGQLMLSEPIRPSGPAPPYTVDSTFRFQAPPGQHAATVTYAGCRTFGDQLDSSQVELRIPVRRGRVTLLRFDGSTLQATMAPGSGGALAD